MTTRFVGRIPQEHKCQPGGFFEPWVGNGAPLQSTPENPVYRWRSRYTPWAPEGTVERCDECGQYWEARMNRDRPEQLSTEWFPIDYWRLMLLRTTGVIDLPEEPTNEEEPGPAVWSDVALILVLIALVIIAFLVVVR